MLTGGSQSAGPNAAGPNAESGGRRRAILSFPGSNQPTALDLRIRSAFPTSLNIGRPSRAATTYNRAAGARLH
jgi:hypothetical protein